VSLSLQVQQVCRTIDEAGRLHVFRSRVAVEQLEEVAWLWQDSRSRRFFPQAVEPQQLRATELADSFRELLTRAHDVETAVRSAEAAAALVALRVEEAEYAIAECRRRVLLAEDLTVHADNETAAAEAAVHDAERLLQALG
jgi:hypothetical protein